MTPELGGIVGLATLIVAVFARLRADMGKIEQRIEQRMDGLEQRIEQRIGGLEQRIDGLRDAVTGRKDAA